ncbi:uncharacterized protein LOC121670827 [Corvus kubaryi]|uniref:uncharacterized protein LOC121670827 n=1 Tax=Corvus kubaryi TaxID=68294 RepID=UPI001C04BB8C|nr:uncharacterized protein LOC121670827 [Corvus kubaryi]
MSTGSVPAITTARVGMKESEAREGKEPDNEGQRAFRGTLEIRFFPAPRWRGAPGSPFRSAPRTAPAPARPRCPGQGERHRRGGAGSGCAEPSLPPGRAGGCRRRTPASPAPLPASQPLWVALCLKPRRSAKPCAEPPGRGCGCSEPGLTTIYSSRPRRRQGESSKPWGSAGPPLAHLQRGCTARLETLANSHLQRTCLKMRPKPEPLQLSGFIQNSPHQLKSLKHLCQVHTPRPGHSEMCRSHRESSKSSPPAVLFNQSAIFSSHVTSLRLLLECTLGTGYRESLCSWGPRRLGFCFESRCLLRM